MMPILPESTSFGFDCIQLDKPNAIPDIPASRKKCLRLYIFMSNRLFA
jgi:hypothetical protein